MFREGHLFPTEEDRTCGETSQQVTGMSGSLHVVDTSSENRMTPNHVSAEQSLHLLPGQYPENRCLPATADSNQERQGFQCGMVG